MMMQERKDPIDRLIDQLARLPGLGPRSARRAVLYLLSKRTELLFPMAGTMQDVAENVRTCVNCGNLSVSADCPICSDVKRDRTMLCVVEQVSDLWAMERAGFFKGQYHVLGGVLSPFDGVGPDALRIPFLQERVARDGIAEVVLALNATLDGQTTAHYISDLFGSQNVKVSGLAKGMPMGGELDFLDDGTIETAFRTRHSL